MIKSYAPRDRSAAFLWDESFLWGLMAYKALTSNGLRFDLLTSSDIRDGRLEKYRMLFVPGGWASNKKRSLGEEGVSRIRNFVEEGGNYLGLCGGAGLATSDGLNLLRIRRKPTKNRVPSFSGRIALDLRDHPAWKGLASRVFNAWWPSQFLVDERKIKVLAVYREALSDSFSSDLNVGDVRSLGKWQELEDVYGINLDPEKLVGDPAVVEGSCGKGRVVLSLIHFDTAGDANGSLVLRNLWDYLACDVSPAAEASSPFVTSPSMARDAGYFSGPVGGVAALTDEIGELISFGQRNFLWFWRNPILLQWRRGVRGLEYCTLYVMTKQTSEAIAGLPAQIMDEGDFIAWLSKELDDIREPFRIFVKESKRLLTMERMAMQAGHITYDKCADGQIRELRARLFSETKSHGGLFKEVIDRIDRILFELIKRDR